MDEPTNGPLKGIRVLDPADAKGLYCTKMLSDLGADVIKIEPPGGDPSREIGPFFKDKPHKEKSLYWFHFNTNKRSITLNLQTADGRDIFKRLSSKADVIVETFARGVMDEMGMGWKTLSENNPRLILASITPFGQEGPWRDYKASDLVGLAFGGLLSTCGWPERAPEKIGGSQQAYHMASLQATVGILMALHQRTKTQKGRHIDISMHASIPVTLMVSVPVYERAGRIMARGWNYNNPALGIFPCQDGYIDFRLRMQSWDAFVKWLDRDGMADEFKGEEWKDPWYRLRPENIQKIDGIFRQFLMKYSKKELYEDGQKRGFEVAPVNTIREVTESGQLRARRYFVPVEHPELGEKLEYLGPPFRLSLTPWKIAKRAPLVGEHNEEIYQNELGLNRQELTSLAEAGVI